MKMKSTSRLVLLCIGISFTFLSFQNCAKVKFKPSGEAEFKSLDVPCATLSLNNLVLSSNDPARVNTDVIFSVNLPTCNNPQADYRFGDGSSPANNAGSMAVHKYPYAGLYSASSRVKTLNNGIVQQTDLYKQVKIFSDCPSLQTLALFLSGPSLTYRSEKNFFQLQNYFSKPGCNLNVTRVVFKKDGAVIGSPRLSEPFSAADVAWNSVGPKQITAEVSFNGNNGAADVVINKLVTVVEPTASCSLAAVQSLFISGPTAALIMSTLNHSVFIPECMKATSFRNPPDVDWSISPPTGSTILKPDTLSSSLLYNKLGLYQVSVSVADTIFGTIDLIQPVMIYAGVCLASEISVEGVCTPRKICMLPEILNTTTNLCECTGSNLIIGNPGICTRRNTCVLPEVLNPSTNTCECNSPNLKIGSPAVCKVPTLCVLPEVLNPSTNICECNSPNLKIGSPAVCKVPTLCVLPEVLSPSTNICECNLPNLKIGNPAVCKVPTSCVLPEVLNTSTNSCECNSPNLKIGSPAVCKLPTSCVLPEVLNMSTNICECNLPNLKIGSPAVCKVPTLCVLPEVLDTITNTCKLPPARVPNVTAVSVGFLHGCAIVDGGAQCWGFNSNGQLGDSTKTDRPTPVKVTGLSSGVTAISAGFFNTCAIVNGAAKCWGGNTFGQLGDGTTTDRVAPTQVLGLAAGVTQITAARYHEQVCAIVNGAAKCWGGNDFGELGIGTPSIPSAVKVPTQVTGLTSGVTEISAGLFNNTCAIVNGAANCWGLNDVGQAGDGTFGVFAQKNTPSAVLFTPNSGVQAISAGFTQACAIVSGSAKCWGGNYYGHVGDGTTTERHGPVQVTGLTAGVTAISAGHNHTCAVVSGAAKCWGANDFGRLGDGSTTNRLVPTQVVGLDSGVQAISSSFYNNCALVNNTVKCWGGNYNYQLGNGTTNSSSVPVAVGPWQ